MAFATESDEVLFGIRTELTSRHDVVNFESDS
jgi:hypothetical protein